MHTVRVYNDIRGNGGDRMEDLYDYPLYLKLYEQIKETVMQTPVGANIPPERRICEIYGVDRVTVRKALAILEQEGYITRRQGRGTTVCSHELQECKMVLFLLCQGTHGADRLVEPFYALSIDKLEAKLHKQQMKLLYSRLGKGENPVDLCRKFDAKAVILAGNPDESALSYFRHVDLTVVCYNTRINGFSSVMVDNEDAAQISAKHLLSLGHKRIGVIEVPGYINSEQRCGGYRLEMERAGLTNCLSVASGDWTENGGYLAAKELLNALGEPITAIFAANDSMAIGTLQAAKELGIRVPQQLSIIGFDGIQNQPVTVPMLTTLKVDIDVMADALCMLLTQIIKNESVKGIHVKVTADFLSRGSTAAAPNQQ